MSGNVKAEFRAHFAEDQEALERLTQSEIESDTMAELMAGVSTEVGVAQGVAED